MANIVAVPGAGRFMQFDNQSAFMDALRVFLNRLG